jgi:hypothetical protein
VFPGCALQVDSCGSVEEHVDVTMKTYPIVNDDGSLRGFQIDHPFTRGPICRVLRSVEGVSDVTKTWFNDDRIKFRLHGEPFVVNEPWGDNSRYWIGPAEISCAQDLSPIHEAFQQYRYSVLPRVALWTTVVVVAALWLQLEKPEHLRGTVSPASDGETYLAIDDDNGGACGDLIVDGAIWPHPVEHPALIEPGIHAIDCGELEYFDPSNSITFEIPRGVVFRFDYWGP